jgi:methenyltetrahydrofolate cyclohydrolase
MILSQTLQEYLDSLSSGSPTPGGGNVASVCGALAASLGTMVCNLTTGKKKYAAFEAEISSLKKTFLDYRTRFVLLAQNDNEAFNQVMESFRLPKESETEREFRLKKIEEATLGAAEIPMEVIKTVGELVTLFNIVLEKGNRNSISDAGVAVSLLRSAAESAYFNVLINCSSLSNQTIALELRKNADIRKEEIEINCRHLIDKVLATIEGK